MGIAAQFAPALLVDCPSLNIIWSISLLQCGFSFCARYVPKLLIEILLLYGSVYRQRFGSNRIQPRHRIFDDPNRLSIKSLKFGDLCHADLMTPGALIRPDPRRPISWSKCFCFRFSMYARVDCLSKSWGFPSV